MILKMHRNILYSFWIVLDRKIKGSIVQSGANFTPVRHELVKKRHKFLSVSANSQVAEFVQNHIAKPFSRLSDKLKVERELPFDFIAQSPAAVHLPYVESV